MLKHCRPDILARGHLSLLQRHHQRVRKPTPWILTCYASVCLYIYISMAKQHALYIAAFIIEYLYNIHHTCLQLLSFRIERISDKTSQVLLLWLLFFLSACAFPDDNRRLSELMSLESYNGSGLRQMAICVSDKAIHILTMISEAPMCHSTDMM